jgi:hypothetical protein
MGKSISSGKVISKVTAGSCRKSPFQVDEEKWQRSFLGQTRKIRKNPKFLDVWEVDYPVFPMIRE